MDVKTLLVHHTLAQGITVRKTKISLSDPLLGSSSSRTNVKSKVMEYYYASVVNTDLNWERHKIKTYTLGLMSFTSETFRKWAFEPEKKAMVKDRSLHKLWVIIAPFCAMSYINDPRYLPGDSALQSDQKRKPKENKMQFLRGKCRSSSKEFCSLELPGLYRFVASFTARS